MTMGATNTWNPSGLAHRRLSGDRSAAMRLAATVLLLALSPYLHSPRPPSATGVSDVAETAARAPRDQAGTRTTTGRRDDRVGTHCD
jgi:hypothetical protein